MELAPGYLPKVYKVRGCPLPLHFLPACRHPDAMPAVTSLPRTSTCGGPLCTHA